MHVVLVAIFRRTGGSEGELETIELRAVAPTWSSQLDQRQVAWHGSVQLQLLMEWLNKYRCWCDYGLP